MKTNDVDVPPCRHRAGYTATPSTYFEVFEPLTDTGQPPVMMVPGGGHSGSCYLVTPDGRPGWTQTFLQAGYRVVLADWPGIGRSGYVAPGALGGRLVVDGLARVLEEIGEPVVLITHSMSGAFGWKLLEEHPDRIARLIGVAPSSPGNLGMQQGVLIRDEGDLKTVATDIGEMVLDLNGWLPMDKIDWALKLVGSSTRFPRETLDRYVPSLLTVGGRLVFERTDTGSNQLRIDDTSGFAGKPILVVTGTQDLDHSKMIDGEIVRWLNEIGALAEFLYLGDVGIEGNGHMMMLEDNNDVSGRMMIDWMRAVG
jgi:pimeloyl-ACP methyl ester carboxylesterase